MNQSTKNKEHLAVPGPRQRLIWKNVRIHFLLGRSSCTLRGQKLETHAATRFGWRYWLGMVVLICSGTVKWEDTRRAMNSHSRTIRCTWTFNMLRASQAGIATRSPPINGERAAIIMGERSRPR